MLAGSAWAALSTGHLGCCAEGCGGAAQRLGTRHGRKATVNVTVSFTTLLGIDDEPGVLHGYGLIHPAVARRIAGEATWRRVLTDPTAGAVLDYGTTRYALPRHLAEHVIMRDVTCRFPTCNGLPTHASSTTQFRSSRTGPAARRRMATWAHSMIDITMTRPIADSRCVSQDPTSQDATRPIKMISRWTT